MFDRMNEYMTNKYYYLIEFLDLEKLNKYIFFINILSSSFFLLISPHSFPPLNYIKPVMTKAESKIRFAFIKDSQIMKFSTNYFQIICKFFANNLASYKLLDCLQKSV